jgi:hypothetical protein
VAPYDPSGTSENDAELDEISWLSGSPEAGVRIKRYPLVPVTPLGSGAATVESARTTMNFM